MITYGMGVMRPSHSGNHLNLFVFAICNLAYTHLDALSLEQENQSPVESLLLMFFFFFDHLSSKPVPAPSRLASLSRSSRGYGRQP